MLSHDPDDLFLREPVAPSRAMDFTHFLGKWRASGQSWLGCPTGRLAHVGLVYCPIIPEKRAGSDNAHIHGAQVPVEERSWRHERKWGVTRSPRGASEKECRDRAAVQVQAD